MTTTLPVAEPPPVAGGRADVVGGGVLVVAGGGVDVACGVGVTVTVLVTTGLERVLPAAVLGCPVRVFEALADAATVGFPDGEPEMGLVVGDGATTVIAVCRLREGPADDAAVSTGPVRAVGPDPDHAGLVSGVGAAPWSLQAAVSAAVSRTATIRRRRRMGSSLACPGPVRAPAHAERWCSVCTVTRVSDAGPSCATPVDI